MEMGAQQNLNKYGFEMYYKCFYVFVGGKFVNDMDILMEFVEDISKNQFHGTRPIAMFVIGKFDTFEINKFSPHIDLETV